MNLHRITPQLTILLPAMLFIMLLLTAGCMDTTSQGQPDVDVVLRTISADDAMILIETTPDLTIIDVRRPDEYEAGHIPGAINIDLSSSFAETVGELDRDDPYLIYCLSGARGASALRIMEDLGFSRVYNIDGGISAWEQAGGVIVR